ncbi:MAG TPA: hypothetical protein DHD79_00070 [Firmicutes bacterium]|jgi:hypothetical protein|nr:hypothetical protein [Bacillota bacterium]HBG43407.1 hypothetical protein [Bacillota bacterium]HBL68495.1 hypothetical protein [Bacillota bacterium]HBR23585.1 hypothetical protein [Bacillota bacterium]HCF88760.1 hypothetical protein [Bacillota bacterium]
MPVGSTQVLIDVIVSLAVPALKVASITANIINLTCQTLANQVLVSGVILETIRQVALATDMVVVQVAALPFSAAVPVPGAVPGEACRVIRAEIEGITVQFVADQLIRQVVVFELEVETAAVLPLPTPQPFSPLFEARPPGTVVFR